MVDATNVKMGVCSVKFNGNDLGHTKGGVTVNYAPEYHDISVDKYGNSVVEKVLIGESLKATVPLAEFTVENLLVAMPASTVGGSNTRATVGKDAGALLSSAAHMLVLHPLANAANDLSEDVVIYKAVVGSEIEIGMNNDGEKIIEVEFEGLIDETKSPGSRLGLFGDSAGA